MGGVKNRFTKYMVLAVLFFSSLSIVFDLAVVDNPHFDINDLAMNLLSEFAGMIFTVAIFNEFLNQKDKLTLAAKSKLLYQELERWLANVSFTFAVPARQCVPEFKEAQLWNKSTLETLCSNLKLDEMRTDSHPQIPWYLFLELQGADLESDCKSLSERFQSIQDSEVTDTLNYFLHKSDMLRSLPDIKTIMESDVLTGHSRPRQLENYYNCPTEEDVSKVDHLLQWIERCKKAEQLTQARNKRFSKIVFILFAVVFPAAGIKYFIGGNYLIAGTYFFATAFYVFEYFYSYYKKKRKH